MPVLCSTAPAVPRPPAAARRLLHLLSRSSIPPAKCRFPPSLIHSSSDLRALPLFSEPRDSDAAPSVALANAPFNSLASSELPARRASWPSQQVALLPTPRRLQGHPSLSYAGATIASHGPASPRSPTPPSPFLERKP
ncbi:hypothetical protein PAHAL_9G216100 [Panicum hallii]|uniref:Uncharacterized protein n=1 Tax=Panicum hallii TaxID=206008 RepID=A0A2T8I205_9POAL|nr:hypothetical protein PAHAL_9G216100 [Panicum hallii]